MFFSWLDWRYVSLGEDHRGRVPLLSQGIKGACDQPYLLSLMLALVTWLRWCLSGFSTVDLLIFPLPVYSSEGSHCTQPALKEWGLRRGVSAFTIILLYGWFVSCLLFIYLSTIYLLISVWTHGYVFHTLGYNPIIVSFCCLNRSSLATGGSFIWLLTHPIILLFEHFPTFWPCRMLQAHLVHPLLHPWISRFLKEPWFLLLEHGLRYQGWALGVP